MLFGHPQARGEAYTPIYFLAALGAGGIVVTFFMWLLFWVPHPGRPVPVFEDIAAVLAQGSLLARAAVVVAMAGILVFSGVMARLMAWNVAALAEFRRTAAHARLRAANEETQLLAAPLASAMAVNVGFILGLVFVPGLWSVVEWLFPAAMAAFLALGVWALRLMGAFWGRVLVEGGFDCSRNNSFAQLLPAFALAMVGVGLAAPAAMSATPWVAGASFVTSSFFVVAAMLVGAVTLFLGARAMMERGADATSAPSLWIAVPIVTVIAIALMRQEHGAHAHFMGDATPAGTFAMLTRLLAVQIAFGLLGWVVLRRQGYFGRYVLGREVSPGAYALVCPGVALTVMLQFFVNKGLLGVGIIEKFGAAYWTLTALPLALQLASIALVLRLNALHFARRSPGSPHPA
jgi:hypothetical protein